MTLQEQINAIKKHHEFIIAGNNNINQIQWLIEDVAYSEFEGYRTIHNSAIGDNESHYIEQNNICGRLAMFLHPWMLGLEKILITVYCKPVKFKTNIEVIEEADAQR